MLGHASGGPVREDTLDHVGRVVTRIDKLDWMSPETKVKAHAKLAAFTPKIGYPSQWRDMSGLVIDRNDLIGNAMRSARFEHEYNVGKLGNPIVDNALKNAAMPSWEIIH